MRVPGRTLSVASLAAALTVGLVGAGLAQDATPTATGDEMMAGAFGASLDAGNCDDASFQTVQELAVLQFPDWFVSMTSGADADEIDVAVDAETFGNAPIPVAVSSTEVPLGIDDIVAGGHAITVDHPDDPSVVVACGNIGGAADDRGDLFVGLAPVDDAVYSGVAWLHDNGGSTTVVVFLSDPSAQTTIDMSLAAMAAAAMAEEEAAASPEAGVAATPVAAADATPVT